MEKQDDNLEGITLFYMINDAIFLAPLMQSLTLAANCCPQLRQHKSERNKMRLNTRQRAAKQKCLASFSSAKTLSGPQLLLHGESLCLNVHV